MKAATKQVEQPYSGIEISLRELKQSLNSLNSLFSQKAKKDVLVKFRQMLRLMNKAFAEFENDRVALCEKYGTLNAEKTNYDMTDENKLKWTEEIEKLGDKIVQLPFKPLKLNDLGNIELNTFEFDELSWLINLE